MRRSVPPDLESLVERLSHTPPSNLRQRIFDRSGTRSGRMPWSLTVCLPPCAEHCLEERCAAAVRVAVCNPMPRPDRGSYSRCPMNCDAQHDSVLIVGVPIDVEIAPLIEALWERGIETLNSCQDNGDNHQVCGSSSLRRTMRADFRMRLSDAWATTERYMAAQWERRWTPQTRGPMPSFRGTTGLRNRSSTMKSMNAESGRMTWTSQSRFASRAAT
jgi:hypothetical protein